MRSLPHKTNNSVPSSLFRALETLFFQPSERAYNKDDIFCILVALNASNLLFMPEEAREVW